MLAVEWKDLPLTAGLSAGRLEDQAGLLFHQGEDFSSLLTRAGCRDGWWWFARGQAGSAVLEACGCSASPVSRQELPPWGCAGSKMDGGAPK